MGCRPPCATIPASSLFKPLHGLLVFSLLALVGLPGSTQAQFEDSAEPGFENAIELLTHTPTGRTILNRAQVRFNLSSFREITRILRWSTVSKTDAVLTRKFNPVTGQEYRERQVTVNLKQGLPLRDLALDLAHELTHAASTPNWDPYDPELTTEKYIRAAIEGEGGEVDAFVNECRVALELESRYGVSAARCSAFRTVRAKSGRAPAGGALAASLANDSAVDSAAQNTQDDLASHTSARLFSQEVNREEVTKHFYRVGASRSQVVERLGDGGELRFPYLSDEKPSLYSSTGQAPYPVALIREYDDITEAACSNSRRRLVGDGGGSASRDSKVRAAAVKLIESRCSRTPASVRRD